MDEVKTPKYVLDSSALLAWLHKESGFETVDPLLPDCVLSAVNWPETVQKIIAKGVQGDIVKEDLQILGLTIQSCTQADAELAASLWAKTKSLGLSLGDRACLALGLRLNLPVIPADRVWTSVNIDVTIQSIR